MGGFHKEGFLRQTLFGLEGIGAVFIAAPAMAQTYDLNYPVCLQVYAPDV